MARRNIVLDIDGVLADFFGAFKRKFNRTLMHMDSTINDDEWKALKADEAFWTGMPALDGGKYLASISPLGSNYYLLTSRPREVRTYTLAWLENVGIDIASSRFNENLLMVHP